MQGIFQKENTDKALKYGIYRHLPTYEKIIRNLVSFYDINFKATYESIRDNHYVDKIIGRIPYTNPDTGKQMEQIRNEMNLYIQNAINENGNYR